MPAPIDPSLQLQLQQLLSNPDALVFALPLDNGQLGPVKEVLRTPDSCFAGLPDFPFEPHYFECRCHGQLRMHYLDHGPRDAEQTILLMHGMPVWSYCYRHMIGPLAAAGYRVVVPDMIGFGRSDKPVLRTDHSFERHVDWLAELVVGLELDNLTAVLHDWGGSAMLRVIARMPERFLRVVVAGTGLLTGCGMSEQMKAWAGHISLKIAAWGPFVNSCSSRPLSTDEQAAYDAPFPSEEYKAIRGHPQLQPTLPDHPSVEENKGAWRRVYEQWNKPLLTIFPDAADKGNDGGASKWIAKVPGAKGQEHVTFKDGQHFFMEGHAQDTVEQVLRFMHTNPVPLNYPTVIRDP